MFKKQQQFTIFTPKLHLECMCHLIKQLTTLYFGGHSFINPLEGMFTSAVGFGEHFLGVDKSQCPPYEKSLIV